jgi:hypothetical protein
MLRLVMAYATAAILTFCSLSLASAQLGSESEKFKPWEALDKKAAAAQDGSESSNRDLAHELLKPVPLDQQVKTEIEDRLTKSEVTYKHGKHPAIKEADVVKALNKVMDQAQAPEYAKTNWKQVRYLRLDLMGMVPHFVGPQHVKQGDKSIPNEMSPLEATYITLALLHRKISSEDYQLDEKEWDEAQYQKNLAKWKAHQQGTSEPPRDLHHPELKANQASDRTTEMRVIARQFAAEMSPDDQRKFAHRILDDLGVQR